MPSIYAPDARWESGDMGVSAVGLDAIMAGLPESTAMVGLSMHSFLNPVIAFDGGQASGHWLFWIASIIDADPRAVYMSSDLTCTRTAQRWLIQSARMHFGMLLHHI